MKNNSAFILVPESQSPAVPPLNLSNTKQEPECVTIDGTLHFPNSHMKICYDFELCVGPTNQSSSDLSLGLGLTKGPNKARMASNDLQGAHAKKEKDLILTKVLLTTGEASYE